MTMTPPKPAANQSVVVVSERSLRGLLAIRHDWLLRDMFDLALMARSAADPLREECAVWPTWISVIDDVPDSDVQMPDRIRMIEGSDRESLKLTLACSADMVLIEGKDLLAKVKLSFIRAMGVVPLLVQAYQQGVIKRIQPLLTALERTGFEMPPPEQYEALLKALDTLG